MNIGEKIKKIRLSKGLTLQEVANEMDLTQGTLSKYENGDIKNIPNTRLKKLSKILDVDVSYFYEDKKDKKELIVEKLIELTENNKIQWISPNNPNEDINFDLRELVQEINKFSNELERSYYSQTNENSESDILDTIYLLEINSNWYCICLVAGFCKLFVFRLGYDSYLFIESLELIADDFDNPHTDLSLLYDLASGNEDSNKSAFFQDLLEDLDNFTEN